MVKKGTFTVARLSFSSVADLSKFPKEAPTRALAALVGAAFGNVDKSATLEKDKRMYLL
jgi:hypothetical protein